MAGWGLKIGPKLLEFNPVTRPYLKSHCILFYTSMVRGGQIHIKEKRCGFSCFIQVIYCGAHLELSQFSAAIPMQAAKEEKKLGNCLVWDHLGHIRDVGAELQKILQAWFRPETLGASTLITTPRYALSAFVLPPGVKQWMETQSLSHALILQGPPGTGKTEMAVSALLQLCPGGVHFVSKQDQMKKIEVRPGQGILLDEACFRESSVDDAKAWVDVAFARDVRGRCSDGHIPPLTRRVFTTNHDLAQFWPVEYFTPNHKGAIDRRTVWVECPKKLFKSEDRLAHAKRNVTNGHPKEANSIIMFLVCFEGDVVKHG